MVSLSTLRIDFSPGNTNVRVNKEAARYSGSFLDFVRVGTVSDPVVALAPRALPVRRHQGARRERVPPSVLGPVLLVVHLGGVGHHLVDLVLLAAAAFFRRLGF